MIPLKTRVKILAVVVVVAAVLLGGAHLWLLFKNQDAVQGSTVAAQISLKVFERRLLSDEYTTTHSARAKTQWLTKQQEIEKFITDHRQVFNTPLEQQLIKQISNNLAESKAVTAQLVDLYENSRSPETITFLDKKVTYLVSQLAVKSQETVSAATNLQNINREKQDQIARQLTAVFITSGGLFLALLLISLAEMWRAANRLDQQRAESNAMLRDIGDGVFALDTEKRIVLFNRAASVITGYSEAEALGKPYDQILTFLNHKTGRMADGFIGGALAGKKTLMGNGVEVITKSGRHVPVADSAAPLKDGKGAIIGIIIVFRDVTAEQQLERAKDEFLSIASHQLRTPLGSMRWSLELLLKQKLPHSAKQIVEEAHGSSLRMSGLINDLLSVSRIDQGRTQDNPAPTELTGVIRSAIQEIRPLAKERQVSLKFTDNKAAPMVTLDPKRFREVFQNLLSNAIKYSTVGGSVTASLQNDSNAVLLSVTNHGAGIPSNDQKYIFDKFYRASNATKTNTDGSGLGLYVVKSFVDAWGGKVWFESIENHTTTFYVSIPRTPHRATTSTKGQHHD